MTTQAQIAELTEYAEELRGYIARNQNTPVCARQVADRRIELELAESRIKRLKEYGETAGEYIPAAIPAE